MNPEEKDRYGLLYQSQLQLFNLHVAHQIPFPLVAQAAGPRAAEPAAPLRGSG